MSSSFLRFFRPKSLILQWYSFKGQGQNQKGEQVMIYRKLFRMLTAGLFVLAVSIPAMASDQNAPIEKEILALDMSWGQAAAKADGIVLGKLLADDLYHVHASGNIETKATYIDSLVSGKMKHEPIVPQEVKVRVYGDTAISTGKFKMVAYKEGMAKPMVDQVNVYVHVWRKTPTGWQLAVHQATAEGGMKMPGMDHGAMPPGAMGHEGMNHGGMTPSK
jgi:ketosteroid isomerase-like protein